ncbi:hypothetical protein X970_11995 [Pseudomonas monteilii SB3101]|uniref:Phage tail protein n=1 Tax=Pseudomonas monteilii SB3101 TaxID=1435058 RepID=V9UXX8_9PSED|nr:hypothetical protein [Pseudomonas monteilii]AHC82698.1 hypothetical protein X969_12350 [Pseudomonas monteilii SB3078]AHC88074.1 hypothetical protein X970_11995 [Pseudomonas monteilii SB3101]
MQKRSLSVNYGGQFYAGFAFADLPLGAALRVAIEQIDQAADAARAAVLVDPLRALEYERTAVEARAFAAAGYAGEVPLSVQAWADAAELTAQQSADSILVEVNAWEAALYAIRAQRLKGKQQVLKATSHDDAEALTDATITAIRASVEGVGSAA